MASGGFPMRNAWRVLLPISGLVLLAACGGSGTLVAGGGTGGTGISTGSITAVGSITVNGVTFNTDNAITRLDDTGTVPSLSVGKVVKVRGVFNPDNVTGTAEDIEVENEVRGNVAGPPGVDTFTVHGQTVLVTGATLFVNDAAQRMGALADGTPVEVHGFRNAVDNVVATRVEILAPGLPDELRGIVADKTGTTSGTFTIQGSAATFTFDIPTSTTVEGGATFAIGDLVEVRLSGALATRIELEDAEDVDFEPGQGDELEVEGFVSGYTNLTLLFSVGGTTVDGSTARIKGGLPINLRNGIIVEAKGTFSNGVLVAAEIELEDSVEIQATVTQTAAGSLTVLGKTVLVTAQTVQDPAGFFGMILPGTTRVRMRGFENLDGTTITALRLEGEGEGFDVLQGFVTLPIDAPNRLTILGIAVDTTLTPPSGFKDDSDDGDQVIPATQFYGSLVPDRTVVKARGAFSAGTLTATEVELE